MKEVVLELKHISKRYEEKVVVDHVSLVIHRGEAVGILGPNGAGKSTIINMIAGSISPTIGSLSLFGAEEGNELIQGRRKLGLVPQELALYHDLKVWENVELFGGLYGLKKQDLKEAIDWVLEFVGLSDHNQEYVKKLSEGMKRRLNMACAIVHKPEFLIFDEPTVAIDPQSRRFILEKVRRLNESGSTILYTSHYVEEVEKICQKIIILDYGKMIAFGTRDELIKMVAVEGEHLSLEEVFIRLTGKPLRA